MLGIELDSYQMLYFVIFHLGMPMNPAMPAYAAPQMMPNMMPGVPQVPMMPSMPCTAFCTSAYYTVVSDKHNKYIRGAKIYAEAGNVHKSCT